MELIQKDDHTSTPVAKASAKCWASKWALLLPYFERITGRRLAAGMKVLLRVYPQFHEAYGFSWIVTDIDPTYTLGDMARKRQDIIHQLKAEGIFDMQKGLEIPLFCQRIAVISSETAAGYGDFCNQLQNNPYGFSFHTWLFPATMQGETVEQSIINALNRINAVCDDFDVVVIIRGGGATSDMSGFDTLALAENVANFPLPIITGIGHERDESILDMVSHTRVKTPTAAAAFLISSLKEVLDSVLHAEKTITSHVRHRMELEHVRLKHLSEAIPRLFLIVRTRQEASIDSLFNQLLVLMQHKIVNQNNRIETLGARLPFWVERKLTRARHQIEIFVERLKILDPDLLLKRGYSITLKNGKTVRNPSALKKGDLIETRMEKGVVRSVVDGLSFLNVKNCQ